MAISPPIDQTLALLLPKDPGGMRETGEKVAFTTLWADITERTFGDAAIDWACLINTYGEQFVRRMHHVYPIPQATIDRARFLAGALELEWALGGIESKDLSLLRDSSAIRA